MPAVSNADCSYKRAGRTGACLAEGVVRKVEETGHRGTIGKHQEAARKIDRELANSVLEVSIEANRQIVEELMRSDSMGKILMEIMEPQLLIREKKGLEQGRRSRSISFKPEVRQGLYAETQSLSDRSRRQPAVCNSKCQGGAA